MSIVPQDNKIEWVNHDPRLNNLCAEIYQPTVGQHDWCTLGMSDALIEYLTLPHIWQTQVHSRFKDLYDTKKIIQSSYSGSTPDQNMDPQACHNLANALYDSCEPTEEAFTVLDNTLGAIRAVSLEERTKLFGSFAIQHALKEQGIMTATTQQIDAIAATTQVGGSTDPHLGERRDELPPVNAITPSGKSEDTAKLIDLIEGAVQSIPTSNQFVDLSRKARGSHKLSSLDGTRKPKRKKSKNKSNHIPNMKNARTKSALGAIILGRLGQVQRDTQDAYKKALLKELPAADVIEMATGEKLPDYQANLINAMQAKADPSAPVVKRMQDENIDTVDGTPEPTRVERQAIFEKNLDEALAKYITPDLLPEGASDQSIADIISQLRAHFVERNLEITQQAVITKAMEIVHPLETITV